MKAQEVVEVASTSTEINNELNLGDVQLVNTEPAEEINENVFTTAIVPNEEMVENVIENENTINQSNITTEERDNYFIETKLQRDSMYSETLEIYQKMLDNTDVSSEQKAIASQEIADITNIKNGTMIAENLIKNKGFEDVVILANNGIISVIVKSTLLTQEQVAKIQNIVSRELNTDLKNINISNK